MTYADTRAGQTILRILFCLSAKTIFMQFTPHDNAPETGEYLAYDAFGACVGSVLVHKNSVLPPLSSPLCYYEKLCGVCPCQSL